MIVLHAGVEHCHCHPCAVQPRPRLIGLDDDGAGGERRLQQFVLDDVGHQRQAGQPQQRILIRDVGDEGDGPLIGLADNLGVCARHRGDHARLCRADLRRLGRLGRLFRAEGHIERRDDAHPALLPRLLQQPCVAREIDGLRRGRRGGHGDDRRAFARAQPERLAGVRRGEAERQGSSDVRGREAGPGQPGILTVQAGGEDVHAGGEHIGARSAAAEGGHRAICAECAHRDDLRIGGGEGDRGGGAGIARGGHDLHTARAGVLHRRFEHAGAGAAAQREVGDIRALVGGPHQRRSDRGV